MEISIGKKPSAWIPVVMSLGALVLVLIQLGIHGVEPERDERAIAHLWQLLMAAQLPIIAFFAFRWVRRARWQAVTVLVVQAVAAAAASVLPCSCLGGKTCALIFDSATGHGFVMRLTRSGRSRPSARGRSRSDSTLDQIQMAHTLVAREF